MTSSVFNVTAHSTFCRKHTSVEPILIKIGTIVHFDVKKSQQKFQTDSDNFDGVTTSFEYDVTSKTDDVITPPKLSEFFCVTF